MVVTLSLLNRFSRLFILCLKKFPPLNYLKLCQNLTIFKNFCTAGKVRNLLQHHMTVMLLHYLEKLKIQIFRRYSADMEENANKLHFECTDFYSSTRATVYTECICVLTEYLKYLSIRKHSYFLRWNASAGNAQSAASWPPANCACVSQLFQQLINATLCPAFVRKFVCQPLCCVSL